MKRKPAAYYAKHPNCKMWRDKADRLWSELVRKQYATCPICGNSNTQAHHLLTKGAHPQYRLALMNGIGLCYQCHVGQKPGYISAHGTPRAFDDWLKEHAPDRWAWVQTARREDRHRERTWKEEYERLEEIALHESYTL
jgi:hypothetical protein